MSSKRPSNDEISSLIVAKAFSDFSSLKSGHKYNCILPTEKFDQGDAISGVATSQDMHFAGGLIRAAYSSLGTSSEPLCSAGLSSVNLGAVDTKI